MLRFIFFLMVSVNLIAANAAKISKKIDRSSASELTASMFFRRCTNADTPKKGEESVAGYIGLKNGNDILLDGDSGLDLNFTPRPLAKVNNCPAMIRYGVFYSLAYYGNECVYSRILQEGSTDPNFSNRPKNIVCSYK